MAWMRTSIAMVGFGFTIYKFFQYLTKEVGSATAVSARNLGITLVALGALMLLGAICEHGLFLRKLSRRADQALRITPALVASTSFLVVGLLALVHILTGIGPF